MDKYKTWFIAIKHSTDIESEFKKYLKKVLEPTALYLCCREISTTGTHKQSNGQHYHFVAQITDKGYKAFIRHFKEKYELQGQAKNGIGRQYGIQKVKDIELLCTYLAKDVDKNNSWVTTNFNNEDLQRYVDQSYKKYTYESYKYELFQHLTGTTNAIEYEIIAFHLAKMEIHQQLKPIRRNQVESLRDEYEQRHKKIPPLELYNRWFN